MINNAHPIPLWQRYAREKMELVEIAQKLMAVIGGKKEKGPVLAEARQVLRRLNGTI